MVKETTPMALAVARLYILTKEKKKYLMHQEHYLSEQNTVLFSFSWTLLLIVVVTARSPKITVEGCTRAIFLLLKMSGLFAFFSKCVSEYSKIFKNNNFLYLEME